MKIDKNIAKETSLSHRLKIATKLSVAAALTLQLGLSTAEAVVPEEYKGPIGNLLNNMVFGHYRQFVLQKNDINNRLGSLYNPTHIHSIWAKGNVGAGSGQNDFKDDYVAVQLGYDQHILLENNGYGMPLYLGLNLDYSRGNASGTSGNAAGGGYDAKLNGYGVTGYLAYARKGGLKFETALKYLNLTHNGDITGNQLFQGFPIDKVSTNSFSLLINGGYNIELGESFYLEPNLGISIGYVPGIKVSNISRTPYEFSTESITTTLAHVGLTGGYLFNAGGFNHEARLGLIYSQDINNNVNYNMRVTSGVLPGTPGLATGDQIMYSLKNDKNLVATLGFNTIWTTKWRTYFELRREFIGNYNQTYALNAGIRYNFGSKSILVAKPPMQDTYIEEMLYTPEIERLSKEMESRQYELIADPEPTSQSTQPVAQDEYPQAQGLYAPPPIKRPDAIRKDATQNVAQSTTQGTTQDITQGAATQGSTTQGAATQGAPTYSAAPVPVATTPEKCELGQGYYYQVAVYTNELRGAGLRAFSAHPNRAVINTKYRNRSTKTYLIGPYENRDAMRVDLQRVKRTVSIIHGGKHAEPYTYYLSEKAAREQTRERHCQ